MSNSWRLFEFRVSFFSFPLQTNDIPLLLLLHHLQDEEDYQLLLFFQRLIPVLELVLPNKKREQRYRCLCGVENHWGTGKVGRWDKNSAGQSKIEGSN